MPLVGFIGDDGKSYATEEALRLSEIGDKAFASIPYALLKGIVEGTQDRGQSISATSILHCLRSEYLQRTEPYYAKPESQYAMYRGTLFHSLLERHAPPNGRVEERHRKTVNGVEISGQFDSLVLYENPETANGKRWRLIDWKTSTSLPKYDTPYPAHVAQLNIYRWLTGLPVDDTEIQVWYFDMSGYKLTRFRDGSGRTGKSDFWDDATVEKFVADRIVKLRASYVSGIPMPYAMVEESEKWLCPYCPVKGKCDELAATEAEANWRRNAGLPPVGSQSDLAPGWQQIVDGVLARLEAPVESDKPAAVGRQRSASPSRPRGGKR